MLLDQRIIIDVLFLLIAIIFLLLLSIYLHVRLRRTVALVFLQFSCLSMIATLTSLFLYRTSFNLPHGSGALFASYLSLGISLTSLAAFILATSISKYLNQTPLILPPDISSFLVQIEDLIIIYNSAEKIIGINHHDKFDSIFSDHKADYSFCSNDKFFSSNNKHYMLKAAAVKDRLRSNLGTVVIIHDVTEAKKLADQINISNEQLELTCQKLESRIEVQRKLETEKQKLIIIEDIQNNLSQRLEAISVQILSNEHTINQGTFQQSITVIADELRNIYRTVRKTVHSMNQHDNIDRRQK